MKELTIEEKAKRYDNIIEKANKMHHENCEACQMCIEELIPELAESEDERIRKWIIDDIRYNMNNEPLNNSEYKKNAEKAIAWLENQGEKPADKVEPKFDVGYTIAEKNNSDIHDFGSFTITDITGGKYWYNDRIICDISEQDEWEIYEPVRQKSTEWEPQTGDTFRKKGTTSPTYHLCDKLEDGITFDFVENRKVGMSGGEITISTLKQDYELVERPKSIEDVVEEELNKGLQTKVEQNPAEWSEEDKKILKEVISNYESACLPPVLERERILKELKSLKERHTWKPSDEQMEALLYEVNAWDEDSINGQDLKSLYQDLKKLREE